MNHCLQSTDCGEELLIDYKRMVLVLCSDPASQESKLGATGSIALKPTATCTQTGSAEVNAYDGAEEGDKFAGDCPGRRLAPVPVQPFIVSDGQTTYHVTAMDGEAETSSTGEFKSFTATLTGPEPEFELDVHVELAPFSGPGKGPEEIVFPTPEGFWLNAASLWSIGVSPKVKGALEAARSATGGRAVVTESRRLHEDKKEGATLGEFEKAGVMMHFLKVSRTGIHHMINEQRKQTSWGAVVANPMVAALVVVLALGAFRRFMWQKNGYVAPEEQDEETQPVTAE
jgi:hypothetical protein